MTDKEIIKSLECCHSTCGCHECYYAKKGADDCLKEMKSDILDLINRLEIENENYSHNIKQLTEECRVMKETLTGGNGIRIRVDNMIVYADDLEEWLEFCDKQKTEAIKECLEKLKDYGTLPNLPWDIWKTFADAIDSFAKEMVGEQDG